MEKIKFATSNTGKLREASEILGTEVEAVYLGEIDEIQTINVLAVVKDKARQAFEMAGEPILVEDTGVYVTAWNGFPWALIKWVFDSAGTENFLSMMEWFADRSAEAVCIVGSFNGVKYRIGTGKIKGTIPFGARGQNGFGWDSVFVPDGSDKTFAEMTSSEKNAISMRRSAFENYLSEEN